MLSSVNLHLLMFSFTKVKIYLIICKNGGDEMKEVKYPGNCQKISIYYEPKKRESWGIST